MKKLLVAFLVLFIAVGFGFLIQAHTGYVMVVYHHWVITTNFWVAVITLIICFILLYSIIRLFKNTAAIPDRIENYTKNKRRQKKHRYLLDAITAFLNGELQPAEKSFIRATTPSHSAYLYYLLAAICAHYRKDLSRRNKYLDRAHQKAEGNYVTYSITKASLLSDSGDFESVIHLLQPLVEKQPKHNKSLELLSNAYQKTGAWKAWLSLLPLLLKFSNTPKNELESIEIFAYHELLKENLEKSNATDFQKYWDNVPKSVKASSLVADLYLDYCVATQPVNVARVFIENTLKKNWQPSLLYYYCDAREHDKEVITNKIYTVEHWLKKHPECVTLQIILAKLYYQANLPSKAQIYAEKSLHREMSQKDILLLAETFVQLGDKDLAIQCYKKQANFYNG